MLDRVAQFVAGVGVVDEAFVDRHVSYSQHRRRTPTADSVPRSLHPPPDANSPAETLEAQLYVHHRFGKDVGLDGSARLKLMRFVKRCLEINRHRRGHVT
jgi:hypothetical protein